MELCSRLGGAPGSEGTTGRTAMVRGHWPAYAQSIRSNRVTVLERQAELEAEKWTNDQAPGRVLKLSGVKVGPVCTISRPLWTNMWSYHMWPVNRPGHGGPATEV